MDKINFVNNSEPDLSAENLNLLQTNVENAINDVSEDLGTVKKIFSGSIAIGKSGTVSETISNFKFLYVRPDSSLTYVIIPVIPGIVNLRGINSYAGTGSIELISIRATRSSNGLTFNLDQIRNSDVSTSGITFKDSYLAVTEIYGVK